MRSCGLNSPFLWKFFFNALAGLFVLSSASAQFIIFMSIFFLAGVEWYVLGCCRHREPKPLLCTSRTPVLSVLTQFIILHHQPINAHCKAKASPTPVAFLCNDPEAEELAPNHAGTTGATAEPSERSFQLQREARTILKLKRQTKATQVSITKSTSHSVQTKPHCTSIGKS